MKITDVQVLRIERLVCVRIDTDDGVSGFGEAHPASGSIGPSATVAAAVAQALPFLLGRDPSHIEDTWQHLFRRQLFRGGPDAMAALSAIDVALWDVLGQELDRPIHRLLGGPVRDRVRAYTHVNGDEPDAVAASAREAVANGFTAVRVYPFGSFSQPLPTSTIGIARTAARYVEAVRSAVGDNVDITVDAVCRLTPGEAMEVARAIGPYHVLWFEDPIEPDDPAAISRFAAVSPVPVATGERFLTVYQFRQLIADGTVAYIRPDVGLVGGITGFRKIAAIAEAAYVGIAPHNPLGPILTATNLQLAAATYGVSILEHTGNVSPAVALRFKGPEAPIDGFQRVPTDPGLGASTRDPGGDSGGWERSPLINTDGSLRDY